MSITAINYNAVADVTLTGGVYNHSSTTAGNLLVVVLENRTSYLSGRITGITNGGDSFVEATTAFAQQTARDRALSIWYCLSCSGSKTSITVNGNSGDLVSVNVIEYHSSLGTLAFDVGGKVTDGTLSGLSFNGPSITLTGSNCVVVAREQSPDSTYASVASPYTGRLSDGHGNETADALNQGSGSSQAVWTGDVSSGGYCANAAAFKEPAAGSASISPSSSPSSSASSSPSPSVAPLDGIAWGEQSPAGTEEPRTWKRWKIADGNQITVSGDPDWGSAVVTAGIPCLGEVIDTGDTLSKTFTVQRDKYASGSGAVTISIRGSATVFAFDAGTPSWTTYTTPTVQTWQYVQVKMEQ